MGNGKRILGAALAGVGLAAACITSASAAPDFATGIVDAEGGLNARIAPSTATGVEHVYDDGAELSINCRTKGTEVGGTTEWYLAAGEGSAKWVSANYVNVQGDQPDWCGPDRTISATVTKDSHSYQGPSTADEERRFHQAGGGQEVLCYTYTTQSGGKRWVATIEDGWMPASTLDADRKIPFCEAA